MLGSPVLQNYQFRFLRSELWRSWRTVEVAGDETKVRDERLVEALEGDGATQTA